MQELFTGQLLPILPVLQGKKTIAGVVAARAPACVLCSLPLREVETRLKVLYLAQHVHVVSTSVLYT